MLFRSAEMGQQVLKRRRPFGERGCCGCGWRPSVRCGNGTSEGPLLEDEADDSETEGVMVREACLHLVAFSQCDGLSPQAMNCKQVHSCCPERICVDLNYLNTSHRNFCSKNGIRLSVGR